MAWTSQSGAGLRYEVSGRGHRNLILIHELGGCLNSWDEVAGLLEPSFRILRYDQRGAGQSEKVRAAFTFEDQLRDLEAVIQAGTENGRFTPPYDLAGVDAGARLVQAFAARHPDQVSTVMLVSLKTSATDRGSQYSFETADLVEREGMRAIVDATLGSMHQDAKIRDRAVYDAYRARFLGNDPVSYSLSIRAWADAALKHDIGPVGCPCLSIDGGPLAHVDDSKTLAEKMQAFLSCHPRDGFVHLRGMRFHVRVEGSAGAPWLVFSNSLMTDLSLWDEQVEALKADFRILRYDQRGHGSSEVPSGPSNFDELTEDAAALLEYFGIEQATVAGVSMGAVTALLLAARYPQRVSRVVAADGQWFAPPTSRDAWEERMGIAEQGGMCALAGPTIERWFTPDSIRTGMPAIERVRRMIEQTPVQGFIAGASALQSFDIRAEFPKITMPVLFAVGARDGNLPAVMSAMHDAIPGSQFQVIEGAGHLPNVEKPEEFEWLLAQFANPAPRLKPLPPEEMDPDQKRVYDAAVSGQRGRAPGQLFAWLRSPQLADRAQAFGELVRYRTTLAPRLSELAILTAARAWTCEYEWYSHKSIALTAGIAPEIIDAIARRRTPSFQHNDERVVHDFAKTLCEEGRVPDKLFHDTEAALGERATVELVMLLGYYSLVAMTLNTFEIMPPRGIPLELGGSRARKV